MFYRKFYAQENHNYKIPDDILRPGLHVACIFAELWHRGIIKKFRSNGLVVVNEILFTIPLYEELNNYF